MITERKRSLADTKVSIMKILKFYFVLLLATHASSVFAQTGDCLGALNLETKNDLNFTFNEAENQTSDLLTPLCTDADIIFTEDGDLFTQWFTWTIKDSGSLYFTLSMDTDMYDIDFILYKSDPSGNSCTNKEAIRCMFSGETIGVPSDACLFETGLNPTESDFFENGGCNNGDNNFLQQINAISGEEYKLLVIDFTQNEGQNALLELCGTATLGIDDTPCFALDTEETPQIDRLSIFPNPANDQLFLTNNDTPTLINFPFTIMDQFGRVILEKNDNSYLQSIETGSLQPGLYYITINNGNSQNTMKFAKQ